jgi:hypothetical protein
MIFTNTEFWAITLILTGVVTFITLKLISHSIDSANLKKQENGENTFDELNALHEAALAGGVHLNAKEIATEVCFRKLEKDETIELGDMILILEQWRDVDGFYVGKSTKDFAAEFKRPLSD